MTIRIRPYPGNVADTLNTHGKGDASRDALRAVYRNPENLNEKRFNQPRLSVEGGDNRLNFRSFQVYRAATGIVSHREDPEPPTCHK